MPFTTFLSDQFYITESGILIALPIQHLTICILDYQLNTTIIICRVALTQKLALMLFNCFPNTYNVYVDVYVDIAYILFFVVGDSGRFSPIGKDKFVNVWTHNPLWKFEELLLMINDLMLSVQHHLIMIMIANQLDIAINIWKIHF